MGSIAQLEYITEGVVCDICIQKLYLGNYIVKDKSNNNCACNLGAIVHITKKLWKVMIKKKYIIYRITDWH